MGSTPSPPLLFARSPLLLLLPRGLKLWMFLRPETMYQPAVATEGWDGPGAYATER